MECFFVNDYDELLVDSVCKRYGGFLVFETSRYNDARDREHGCVVTNCVHYGFRNIAIADACMHELYDMRVIQWRIGWRYYYRICDSDNMPPWSDWRR